MKNELKVKGFFRAQIVDKKGKVIGNSGWKKNVITVDGWRYVMAANPFKISGSYQMAYGVLGTGTAAVASGASSVIGTLVSDTTAYISLATQALSSAASGGTARVTFQYDGSLGATGNIAQVCLHSAATKGGMMCGNTFTPSALATSQSCNITYDLQCDTG